MAESRKGSRGSKVQPVYATKLLQKSFDLHNALFKNVNIPPQNINFLNIYLTKRVSIQ